LKKEEDKMESEYGKVEKEEILSIIQESISNSVQEIKDINELEVLTSNDHIDEDASVVNPVERYALLTSIQDRVKLYVKISGVELNYVEKERLFKLKEDDLARLRGLQEVNDLLYRLITGRQEVYTRD
jgi:hypothetical protein